MTLTTEETVFKTTCERLRGISYVKKVLEGERQNYLDYDMPCIVVEHLPSRENWAEIPKRRQITMVLRIKGILDIRNRLDNQIVGDSSQVGSIRFINDILKAFEGSDFRQANNLQSYEVEVLNDQNVDNTTREVTIRLELKTNFFAAEART